MFKKPWGENMFKSKTAAGLEVILLPDGNYQLHLVTLKKQKSILLPEIQREALSSFNEVQQLLDSKTPLILIINGKGIVHRKISSSENDTPAILLNKLLPNAQVEDFVIQKTPVNTTEIFVSVIRLNVLTDLIQELVKNNLTGITACFLGPFVITTLLPLLNNDLIINERLSISNFHLQIREQQITNIETITDPFHEHLQIGNDLLPQQLVIAFAGALSYFTGNTNDVFNSVLINEIKEEFSQKQKFELRGWVLLVATFVILIINYFVFNNYWNENKEMNAQLELTQVALQRYDKLKMEFDQKKQFLEQNGLLENSRTSYYADQLSKKLPLSMQFTNLEIHPLKKKKAGEEENGFLFEKKLIRVSGNCQRNTELNEWMKTIKKQNWVEDIVLSNYRQDNARENGIFLVEIKLK
jgi:Tfp pilus assembly protein PilN